MSPSLRRLPNKMARIAALARSPQRRSDWRRERFFQRASVYTPVIAVDDRRGNRYFVTTADPVLAKGMFIRREFEAGNLANVRRILAREHYAPTQVIDVGANVGTASIELLTDWPDACGIAFEPHPESFALLRHNLLANGLTERVKVYNAAVSDEDGSVSFELSPWHPGDHRVRVTDGAGRYREEQWDVTTVPAIRLDTFVTSGEIDPTKSTLLWIDAQGHEAHVLAGARSLRHVPTVVEFWPYGLRRAQTLQAFIGLVGTYAHVIEVTDAPRAVSQAAIGDLAAELDRTNSYRDLLLLPEASRGIN